MPVKNLIVLRILSLTAFTGWLILESVAALKARSASTSNQI